MFCLFFSYATSKSPIYLIAETLLTDDGEQLTEINNIIDAIRHSRSGCGIDLPGGPGLADEMREDPSWSKFFGPDGKMTQDIQAKLASTTEASGNISNSARLKCLHCETMGGYCPTYTYNIPYTCQVVEGKRNCQAIGYVNVAGQDEWDFDTNEGYTFMQNLINEWGPWILVELRGNYKEFAVKFNVDEPVNVTYSQ